MAMCLFSQHRPRLENGRSPFSSVTSVWCSPSAGFAGVRHRDQGQLSTNPTCTVHSTRRGGCVRVDAEAAARAQSEDHETARVTPATL